MLHFTLVSGIPKDIPDFGNATQQARQNPEFDPTRLAQFTSEDYYVWSRIDGTSSLRDLILMIGFDTDKTVGILRRLREFGAVLMPNETPATVKKRQSNAVAEAAEKQQPVAPAKATAQGSSSNTAVSAADELDDSTLSDGERAALAEEIALSDAQKRRVLWMLRTLRTADHFTVFGLTSEASKRDIKRSYFRLSKEFHPDRFYGKELGSFGPWLAAVFAHLTSAFEVLSSSKKRDAYQAVLRGDAPTTGPAKEQSKEEYAQELYIRACDSETSGQLDNALQLFGAAVRMNPKAKYLRRAATCAVGAGELSTAEEYAKKAADLQRQDPSYVRVLADVYRASGNWGEAEKTLLRALDLRTENDVLTSELHADLVEVRRMQAS